MISSVIRTEKLSSCIMIMIQLRTTRWTRHVECIQGKQSDTKLVIQPEAMG